jgi:hypothetical protein
MTMADYKSCAWYQNGTCIRYDKSGAPISCADCEDYERRVVFKIEDLQERNGEMSVRKSCKTCKHFNHGSCFRKEGFTCNEDTGWISWELADDAKADVLHDAETEHDIPKYRSCKLYINGSCDNAKIFADKPGVKLDCSKCKSYIRGYYKLPTNTPTEPKHDAVNHPNHYCKGNVECLDAIKAALGDKYEGFLAGNVLKYVYRYPDKNGVEDCKKARFYLDKLIEVLRNEER